MNKDQIKLLPYIAFGQALLATLSSLYFSEIQQIIPCILCWYQRILMYPLVIIIAVSIVRKNKDLPLYVLPFSVLGVITASYHYLLQRGIVPENLAPCTASVPCASRDIEYFGFVTIPFLSLMAFAFITLCMVIYYRINNSAKP